MQISSPTRLPAHGPSGSAPLRLTLAMSPYEHMHDLVTGTVKAEGITLTSLSLPIEEIAYRHFRNLEFDVAETSFAKYIGTVGAGGTAIVGLPVFPARVFRFSSIYVRRDSGVREPRDLEGRTVGIPEWAQTAGVYIRGLVSEYFGVDLEKIRWIQSGVNEPGRVEKVELALPPQISYESRPDRSLDAMLLSGEIDAAFSARPPESFLLGDERIERLFPDFQERERTYYRDTGIFPIMHLVSMRRAVLDAHPWVAANLVTAFERAKDAAVARSTEITTSRAPIAWSAAHAQGVAALMGGDPWPYGVDPNRHTLDAFCRFAHAQHLTPSLLTAEDLFPAETLTRYRV